MESAAAAAVIWDIVPPEYDVSAESVPAVRVAAATSAAPRTKTQHREVVGLYTDKPLVLAQLDGRTGFYDADTLAFWDAFSAGPAADVPAATQPPANPELVLPPGVVASIGFNTASFFDFEAHDWFVAVSVSQANTASVVSLPGVQRVNVTLPEQGRLCDEAAAYVSTLHTTTEVTCMYVFATEPTACAQALLFAHGVRVFPGMALTDVSTPVVRAQCTTLHAVRQTTLEDDLARCADAVTSGRVTAHAGSLSGLYELPRIDVTRAALTWGMFASLHISPRLFMRDTAAAPLTVFEPLASYAQAVLDVQAARARATAPHVALKYSAEQKPSTAQCQHALVLFYWAAVHVHAPTAALPRHAALLNLELYVRFGLLVVRRRAYHFHNGNKKRRKRKLADAAADAAADDEE